MKAYLMNSIQETKKKKKSLFTIEAKEITTKSLK